MTAHREKWQKRCMFDIFLISPDKAVTVCKFEGFSSLISWGLCAPGRSHSQVSKLATGAEADVVKLGARRNEWQKYVFGADHDSSAMQHWIFERLTLLQNSFFSPELHKKETKYCSQQIHVCNECTNWQCIWQGRKKLAFKDTVMLILHTCTVNVRNVFRKHLEQTLDTL